MADHITPYFPTVPSPHIPPCTAWGPMSMTEKSHALWFLYWRKSYSVVWHLLLLLWGPRRWLWKPTIKLSPFEQLLCKYVVFVKKIGWLPLKIIVWSSFSPWKRGWWPQNPRVWSSWSIFSAWTLPCWQTRDPWSPGSSMLAVQISKPRRTVNSGMNRLDRLAFRE